MASVSNALVLYALSVQWWISASVKSVRYFAKMYAALSAYRIVDSCLISSMVMDGISEGTNKPPSAEIPWEMAVALSTASALFLVLL